MFYAMITPFRNIQPVLLLHMSCNQNLNRKLHNEHIRIIFLSLHNVGEAGQLN